MVRHPERAGARRAASRRRAGEDRRRVAPAKDADERAEALAELIVDDALGLAGEIGWSRIRLDVVADRLGVPLADIAAIYPDLDTVGSALFRRANRRMLRARDEAGFADLPAAERIFLALARWFDALAPHKAAVRDILAYKVRPAHVHLQAGLIVALSRTVQWLRAAANLPATGRQRDIEEVGLTALFAWTVLYWLNDRSAGDQRTRRFLKRRLDAAARIMTRL